MCWITDKNLTTVFQCFPSVSPKYSTYEIYRKSTNYGRNTGEIKRLSLTFELFVLVIRCS